MTTSKEDTQFDAVDEAFFNAMDDDTDAAPLERPGTFDLEAQESRADEGHADPIASERLRARRARLTQAVGEIVATLAAVSGTAFGMNFVRGPAVPSPHVAAHSSALHR